MLDRQELSKIYNRGNCPSMRGAMAIMYGWSMALYLNARAPDQSWKLVLLPLAGLSASRTDLVTSIGSGVVLLLFTSKARGLSVVPTDD